MKLRKKVEGKETLYHFPKKAVLYLPFYLNQIHETVSDGQLINLDKNMQSEHVGIYYEATTSSIGQ